ncbi:recombinase family protein [Brevibacillus sp. MER 51]|uniref:recombinase family protein n=1 Tax=Brevibacillus sp. MER 51 TaxID=2939560 RepID=UPI00203E5586|nr:recombinase family protein [Brevibacillus sp. MER 51]MCM3143913.1 recombinase family protein [Brevibacillus sp. MER 51]
MEDNRIVAFYIRVSTDKQAQEGFSLEAQENVNLDYARRLFGHDVRYEIYIDEGKSGKSTKKRTDLNRMLRDINAGKVKAVITYKVSRLSRTLSDSLKLVEEIHKSKVRFISLKEGEYGTPHGNLQFNILASVAQYQREELSENVQLGMTQRAMEGLWNGGKVLGYKSVHKLLVIEPDEAEIVKLIFHKYCEEGWGTKRIANYLNMCGYRTKNANTFSVDSVRSILGNPVYKGYVRYNQFINWEEDRRKGKNPEYILCKGVHEPIIDETLWEKARSRLDDSSTGIPRRYSGTFPLTGLSKCPECGSFMTSLYGAKRKDGSRKRYYVCGAYHNKGNSVCNPNLIPADWLECAVFERLSNALQSEEILKQLTDNINALIKSSILDNSTEVQALEKKLLDLESRKKKIQKEVELESGLFTESEARERIAEIRKNIEEISLTLTSLQKDGRESELSNIKPITREDVRSQLADFLELAGKLNPLEFRKLLQSSIEQIDASKNHLKQVHFSFIVHMPEKDPLDPLHILGKPSSTLRAIYFNNNHYLFVIRFPPTNPKSPINLLQQHQPHQLMRKRHL